MMYLSIHTPPTTANNLRLVSALFKILKIYLVLLNVFHPLQVLTAFAKQKHVAKVDGMLLKLLNPILWRSLKVANAHVRLNAANMLICFFPLRDGDIPAFENAKLLDRQQEMFKVAKIDPYCYIMWLRIHFSILISDAADRSFLSSPRISCHWYM